jgi:hypothetical protein
MANIGFGLSLRILVDKFDDVPFWNICAVSLVSETARKGGSMQIGSLSNENPKSRFCFGNTK